MSAHRWLTALLLTAVTSVSIAVVACDDDAPAPANGAGADAATSSSSGASTSSTSSSSSTSSTSSSGAVTPPATDLSFEAKFIGKGGPHFISGSVTLPPGAAAGRTVQAEVVRSGDITVSGNQLGVAGVTNAGGTMTFKVTALEPGTYKIGFRVDATNDGKVNDTGDYIGFARGAAGATKTTSASADEIVVGDAPVAGVDFALSVVP